MYRWLLLKNKWWPRQMNYLIWCDNSWGFGYHLLSCISYLQETQCCSLLSEIIALWRREICRWESCYRATKVGRGKSLFSASGKVKDVVDKGKGVQEKLAVQNMSCIGPSLGKLGTLQWKKKHIKVVVDDSWKTEKVYRGWNLKLNNLADVLENNRTENKYFGLYFKKPSRRNCSDFVVFS